MMVRKENDLAPEPTLGLLIIGPELLPGVVPPHKQQPRVPRELDSWRPQIPREWN